MVSEGYSLIGVRTSHCGGFSCRRAQALGCIGFSSCAFGLSSCGVQAQLPCSMWNLPRPGTEPRSPAVAGEFLSTGPPGKAHPESLKKKFRE